MWKPLRLAQATLRIITTPWVHVCNPYWKVPPPPPPAPILLHSYLPKCFSPQPGVRQRRGDDGPQSSPVGLPYWSHSEWVSVPCHPNLSSPPHQSHASVTIPPQTGLHFVPKTRPASSPSPPASQPPAVHGPWQLPDSRGPSMTRIFSQSLPSSPNASTKKRMLASNIPKYIQIPSVSSRVRDLPLLSTSIMKPLHSAFIQIKVPWPSKRLQDQGLLRELRWMSPQHHVKVCQLALLENFVLLASFTEPPPRRQTQPMWHAPRCHRNCLWCWKWRFSVAASAKLNAQYGRNLNSSICGFQPILSVSNMAAVPQQFQSYTSWHCVQMQGCQLTGDLLW